MQQLLQEQEEALKRRDLSALTNLVNDGFDVNLLVIPKNTDILLAAINKEHKTLFSSALNKGFKCKNNNGFLYLHHAIRTNDIFFVRNIVDRYKLESLNFNEYSSDKDNCLHIAAGEINISNEIMVYLTEQGIKWSEQNNEGQTPLHILLNKNEEITEELIELLRQEKNIFYIKDNALVSPLDIINSFSFSSEWCNDNIALIHFVEKEFK
jgi:ankyrin repeat protein